MDLQKFGIMLKKSMFAMQYSMESLVGELSDMITRMVEPESSLEEENSDIVFRTGTSENGGRRRNARRRQTSVTGGR